MDVTNSKKFCDIVTFSSRRINLSLCVITQNLYHGGKFAITCRRNFHTYVIFKSFSNVLQTLSRQLFNNSKILVDAMNILDRHETESHKKYLMINTDCNAQLDIKLRISSNIFGDERYFFVTK